MGPPVELCSAGRSNERHRPHVDDSVAGRLALEGSIRAAKQLSFSLMGNTVVLYPCRCGTAWMEYKGRRNPDHRGGCLCSVNLFLSVSIAPQSDTWRAAIRRHSRYTRHKWYGCTNTPEDGRVRKRGDKD
jgi:hypothetical protein